jgi:hypothetical protein
VTGTMPESCDQCGFVFADVPAEAISERLQEIAHAYKETLGDAPATVARRPAPQTWSPLEYSCHVRDVLLNLRERVFLALVEESPVFPALHREERVALGQYNSESLRHVVGDIMVGARLLGRLFEGADGLQLFRAGIYAGTAVDVRWIGRQAVHEASHHLEDVREGLHSVRDLGSATAEPGI